MERALFDTNVILDIALKRTPHFVAAAKLFELIDEEKITGFITATTITDIYYIAKKEKGYLSTVDFISSLVEVVEVVGVDREVILKALKSDLKDFEDAVQTSAAEMAGIDRLITRNKRDFTQSNLQIFTPNEFIESLSAPPV